MKQPKQKTFKKSKYTSSNKFGISRNNKIMAIMEENEGGGKDKRKGH